MNSGILTHHTQGTKTAQPGGNELPKISQNFKSTAIASTQIK